MENRINFFDNLRYVVILFVIIFHSAFSYVRDISFWPVSDANNTGNLLNIFFNLSISYLDGIMMHILFFISGFFAYYSLAKYNIINFIKNKLKYIGVPFVFMIFFYVPIVYCIETKIKSDINLSFSTIWFERIKTLTEFYIGPNFQNYLNPSYLWFLSLLLVFLLILSFIYPLIKKIITIDNEITNNNYILPIVIFIIVNMIGILLLLNYFKMNEWFLMGTIFLFQPVRLILYFSLFILGVYSFRKDWYCKSKNQGSLLVWFLLIVIFFIADIFIGGKLHHSENPSFFLKFIFSFIRPAYCCISVLFYTFFFQRFLDKNNKIHRNFSNNSYYMYLFHFAIVILAQLFFSIFLGMPSFIKFILVSLLSILISFSISKYLIKESILRIIIFISIIFATFIIF